MLAPFAYNFTKWVKSAPFFKNKIALGWTAEDFKRNFDKELKNYKDPVVYWFDHSSFDAS